MERVCCDSQPKNIEAVGNGNYLFRWDIKEEQIERGEELGTITQYSYLEAVIDGIPDYSKAVSAIIRKNYNADEELALINKFNSYNQGIIEDATIVEEYKEYLSFVAETKSMVKEILNKENNKFNL